MIKIAVTLRGKKNENNFVNYLDAFINKDISGILENRM